MSRNLTHLLESAIQNGIGSIGQISITSFPPAGYELRHMDDRNRTDLEILDSPEAARVIALNTDAAIYRPLKTAPTLRHGWSLRLSNIADLRLALDYFYPAMLGIWASHQDSQLKTVPLRDTLGRQSGMYAATKRLQDEEIPALVEATCGPSSCLKRRLWADDGSKQVPQGSGDSTLPLLCHEACNILVAAAREIVKSREGQKPPPPK